MKKLLTFGILMMMAIGGECRAAENQGFSRDGAAQENRKDGKAGAGRQAKTFEGVIPRALRGGNPLQMLNPKAPAKYGTAEQSVAYNPLTGKYDQIKLFEIFF